MPVKTLTSVLLIFCTIVSRNLLECQANDGTDQYDILNSCNFFDTINITEGTPHPDNKSIMFGGIQFSQEDYTIFSYKYSTDYDKNLVPTHTRCCICKYKSCVRLCCPCEHTVGITIKYFCDLNKERLDFETTVADQFNHTDEIIILGVKPCRFGYVVEGDNATVDNHQWKTALVTKKCIAHAFNVSSKTITIKAMVCSKTEPETQKNPGILVSPIMMLVSIVFLSLTIFLYIWVEKLRETVHGKNVLCYLIVWDFTYSLLFVLDRYDVFNEWKSLCGILAQIIYTAFLFGFIWLSIMSYGIWRSIGMPTDIHKKGFKHYFIFVLGLTLFIVLIINVLNHVYWLDDDFKAGLGKNTCGLKSINDSQYSQFLYLYSVIIISTAINSTFFILTKIKIKRIRNRVANSENSRKFSRAKETDADGFGVLLRLFIIMGILWTNELLCWIFDADPNITYYLNIISMMQGPLIFYLFIIKPRVINMIKRKCGG